MADHNNHKTHRAPSGAGGIHDQVVEVSLDHDFDDNNKSVAIPGTVGIHDQVVEVSLDHDYDDNNKSVAIPGTVGIHDQVVEVSLDHDHDDNNKSVAIPGTVGIHDQVVEVSVDYDNNDKNVSIPGTIGVHDQVVEVLLDQDNNNKSVAIPGTVDVHDQVVEVLLDQDNNDKNVSIPGTVGVHDQVVEVSLDHDNNNKNVSIPGTVGVHEQVAEVLIDHDNNNKNGSIPGTVGVHEQLAEVDHRTLEPKGTSPDDNNKMGAIPGTVGVHEHVTEVDRCDNSNKIGAIPGTVGVHEQVSEIGSPTVNEPVVVGFIRLRGEDEPLDSLTQEHRESYRKKGYLVLPNALTDSQADNLLGEAQNLIKRISEGGKGITRHDIPSGAKRPSPVGRIIATFEPGDKTASNPFQRRIARLGCGVHKLPSFGAVTHSAFNRSTADLLGYREARITQSQLIAKLADVGGEIVPHQDGCVSFTDPPSATTFWYALEDTTLENGCLFIAPGSHLTTPLKQRLIKGEDGLPKFVNLTTPLWAHGALGSPITATMGQTEFEYEALEVKKGTLVVFDGNLMHKSAPNQSDKDRMAYTFNIVEGNAGFPDDSYMKPVEEGLEKF